MANYTSAYTGAEIDSAVQKANHLIDYVYPVGSIYMSVNSTNPATFIGGTWARITDVFLLAGGNSHAPGSVGGSWSHTHSYGIQFGSYYSSASFESNSSSGVVNYDSNNSMNIKTWDSVGSATGIRNNAITNGQTNVSMAHYRGVGNASYSSSVPPYLAVYVWQRIS